MNDPTDVLGRRIGAALLDLVALVVLFVVVGLVFGEGESSGSSASVNLEGLSAVVFFVLVFAYYGVSEAVTGQTLGKRLLGIRVVRLSDGGKPSGGQVLGRTLLRVVDSLPFAYLIGLVTILATGAKRQRVGDLAAGTTVARA